MTKLMTRMSGGMCIVWSSEHEMKVEWDESEWRWRNEEMMRGEENIEKDELEGIGLD